MITIAMPCLERLWMLLFEKLLDLVLVTGYTLGTSFFL